MYQVGTNKGIITVQFILKKKNDNIEGCGKMTVPLRALNLNLNITLCT